MALWHKMTANGTGPVRKLEKLSDTSAELPPSCIRILSALHSVPQDSDFKLSKAELRHRERLIRIFYASTNSALIRGWTSALE